jgi:molybdopterin adenylyltransferase
MSDCGKILALNVSKKKGVVKHPVREVQINEQGIVGDAHAGDWHRQISLLGKNSVDGFIKESGHQVKPGEFAENLLIDGIDLTKAKLMDRFRINNVELELTQIGKKCHGDNCAVYQAVGKCVMPKEGVFCRVISGGKVKQGNEIKYLPRCLKVVVITVSDRVHNGVYADRSGPKVCELLKEFAEENKWDLALQNIIVPDEREQLTEVLLKNIKQADVIFTLGGTGIAPRDITPEVVNELIEKQLPGVMENIRVKYGSKKPFALLSRSVAGVNAKTQIYALPGSVKAVAEYMGEIFKTLEHVVYMLYNLDVH